MRDALNKQCAMVLHLFGMGATYLGHAYLLFSAFVQGLQGSHRKL